MARAASLSSRSADLGALAAGAADAPQRQVDAAFRRDGPARDDGPVGLLHRAAAERGGELRRGARRAGEQQHAGGVAVQPVHQARPIRRAEAQRVEQRVEVMGDAGAALHRHAVRLVQHQHVVVAIDHQALQVARGVAGRSRAAGLRHRAAPAAAGRAPTGRRRAGSPPRRGGRPRGPGRCGTASGSRPGSGRESGGGTSDRAGCPPRRRRRCGRRPSSPPPLAGGGSGAERGPLPQPPPARGGGVSGSQRDRQQRVDLVAVEHDEPLDEAERCRRRCRSGRGSGRWRTASWRRRA